MSDSYLKRKYQKIRNRLLDYYILVASLLSIIGGLVTVTIILPLLGVSILKAYILYLVLIVLGVFGFRIYLKERI